MREEARTIGEIMQPQASRRNGAGRSARIGRDRGPTSEELRGGTRWAGSGVDEREAQWRHIKGLRKWGEVVGANRLDEQLIVIWMYHHKI